MSLPAQQQQLQLQQSKSERDCEQHTDTPQGISSSRHGAAQTRDQPGGTPSVGQGMGDKRLRVQLQASERKLAFFQSWANEQTRETYQHILDATMEALQTFQRSPDSPVGPRSAAEIVSGAPKTRGAQPLGESRQQRPKIEELSTCNDATSSRAKAVSSDEGCTGNGHIAAVSELDYDALD